MGIKKKKFRALGDLESNGLFLTPRGQPEADRIWCVRFINVSPSGWPLSRSTGKIITFTSAVDFDVKHDDMEAVEFYDEEMLKKYGDRIRRTATSGTKIFPMSMLKNYLDRCDVLIGHNFIQYDVPFLNRIMGYDWYKGFELNDKRRIIDTLVMSRTQYVDRPAVKGIKGGPHGLEAWGERNGMPKPGIEDWTVFSMDMVKRLRDDVKNNVMTYVELIDEIGADKIHHGIDWRNPLNIEHRASTIIARAERVGSGFDEEHAIRFVNKLDSLIAKCDEEVLPQLPLRFSEAVSSKVDNQEYVESMEVGLSKPLVDMGHSITEIVTELDEYGDPHPLLKSNGEPVTELKAFWPMEWDWDNDDIRHGKPTLMPYSQDRELKALVQNYFDKAFSTGTKYMTAKEQMDLMFPPRKLFEFPERILKTWLKSAGIKAKESNHYLDDPEGFIEELASEAGMALKDWDHLKDTKDATASKKAGELRTSVPKWLLKETIIGPYTSIREPLKDVVVGPYSKIEYLPYELSSNNQVKALFLKHYEWIPDEFTDKGNPKLTESSFSSMTNDLGMKVQDRFVDSARRTAIKNFKDPTKGWLNLIRDDGQITCRNTPQGTPTARSRHAGVVNVPSVDARWGREMRRCFVAPLDDRVEPWSYDMTFGTEEMRNNYVELNKSIVDRFEFKEVDTGEVDKKGEPKLDFVMTSYVSGRMAQIGCDASGLELRILAHLMNDVQTTFEITDGDFHTILWKLIDEWIETRGDTKTVEYALIFGAGDCKLGSVAKLNRGEFDEDYLWENGWEKLRGGWRLSHWRAEKESITFIEAQNTVIGTQIRERIMKGLKPLGDCIDRIQKDAEQGFLVAIDGRMMPVRGVHAALNLACQSGGALVMKKAFDTQAVKLQEFREKYDDFFGEIVITYHDESQIHCNPKYAEMVGEMMKKSIIDAGEFYELNCPLDAEYKIGLSWLDCH